MRHAIEIALYWHECLQCGRRFCSGSRSDHCNRPGCEGVVARLYGIETSTVLDDLPQTG